VCAGTGNARTIAVRSISGSGDDDPTRTLIRQVLGAVAQFEKSVIVPKLRTARVRTRRETGRCEVYIADGAALRGVTPTRP